MTAASALANVITRILTIRIFHR